MQSHCRRHAESIERAQTSSDLKWAELLAFQLLVWSVDGNVLTAEENQVTSLKFDVLSMTVGLKDHGGLSILHI